MTRTEHLLSILAEECNEVAQRAIKALRFGLEEIQPEQSFTNSERVIHELADLIGVVEMLQREAGMPQVSEYRVSEKQVKVEHFLILSRELGTLQRAETPVQREKDMPELCHYCHRGQHYLCTGCRCSTCKDNASRRPNAESVQRETPKPEGADE